MSEVNKEPDWAKAADHAEKKAEEELEKIKREAREELINDNEKFHNPKDSE